MEITLWIENHILLIVGICLLIIIISLGIFVISNIIYCMHHPELEWCKATNMTKALICR